MIINWNDTMKMKKVETLHYNKQINVLLKSVNTAIINIMVGLW